MKLIDGNGNRRTMPRFDDEQNERGPTSGEREVYPEDAENPSWMMGNPLLEPPRRGPLAGIDLVAYMRTGVIRRLDGGALTEAQRGLR